MRNGATAMSLCSSDYVALRWMLIMALHYNVMVGRLGGRNGCGATATVNRGVPRAA